jgi:hypothetical protein
MSEEKEFKVGPFTVKIEQDENAESPRQWGNKDVFIVANHSDFYVTEPGQKRCPEDAGELIKRYKKTHWVFPLEAYIHGGVVLALAGEGNFPDRQWDVSRLGFVFVCKKDYKETEARDRAKSEIAIWNQYVSGDVWEYSIEDDSGEVLESLCGCYGFQYTKDEAMACAKRLQEKQ